MTARTQGVERVADWRRGELIPATSPDPWFAGAAGAHCSDHSRLLYDVLGGVNDRLGFDAVDDPAFRDFGLSSGLRTWCRGGWSAWSR